MGLRTAGLSCCIRLYVAVLDALPVGRVTLKHTLLFVLWLGIFTWHILSWDQVVLFALPGQWFEEKGFW